MPRRIRPGGPFLVGSSPLGNPPPSPFSPQDFARPQKSKWQAGFSDVTTNLLLTTLAVAAVTVVFRGPIYPAPQKAHQQVVDTAPNLLLTTLAPSAQAPFSPYDWPNPARRATPQADIPPNLLLTPGLAPPFRPVEFQLLKAARAVQFDPPNLLTGTLAPAQVAVPFYQTDWPKPARQASQPGDVWPNLLGTTLAPAVDQAPFQPFDWPNTRGARVQDQWLAPNLQTGTLAPVVVASPFTPYDFTQPRVAYRVSTEIWPASLALLSAPVADPFRQLDWPITRRAQQIWPLDLPSSIALLTTPPGVPFTPVDWQVPRVGAGMWARLPIIDAPNLLMTTLAPPTPPDNHNGEFIVRARRRGLR